MEVIPHPARKCKTVRPDLVGGSEPPPGQKMQDVRPSGTRWADHDLYPVGKCGRLRKRPARKFKVDKTERH